MTAIPADIVSLGDYERYAAARLPRDRWAYIAGAAADGLAHRHNREAFDTLRLNGRIFADMADATTGGQLFGEAFRYPVILAPTAYHRLAHPQGEIATVRGAGAVGGWAVVSMQASHTLEEIATVAASPLWFQLYLHQEWPVTLALVRRAEAAGYRALVVTGDATVAGLRNDEQRAGFRLPPGIAAVNLPADALRSVEAPPGESPVFSAMLRHAPVWETLASLCRATALPVLVKGVMHADDALRALDAGARGIIVSNHGGRALDAAPATIEVLPDIARRLPRDVPLLLDGGVRRGTDIVKALALGAHAVLVGRPVLHALTVAGAAGVAHMLTLLRAELEVAMTQTGCATLAAITEAVVRCAPVSAAADSPQG
ncbi:alpha-hydroxy acid oxidase [Pseudochelatococcus sp. B33]